MTWESGGDLALYLDGEEAARGASTTVVGELSGVSEIVVGSTSFDGVVDDLLFAEQALTPSRIRDLYYAGSGTGPSAPGGERRYVEWPQGVFLLSSPTRTVDERGVVTRSVDAYDQGVVLKTLLRDEPYYIAAGAVVTDAIAELLTNTPGIPQFNVVRSTKTLPAQRVWDAGTSHLTILNDLTSAIGYEAIHFDENGVGVVAPYVAPQDKTPSYRYEADEMSVLVPGATQESDLFDQPNKWVLVVSQPDRTPLVATYTNNDPSSPTSTVTRGRTITDFRTETDVVDLAVLQDKVKTLAQEASEVYETVIFSTALMPIHQHRDVVYLAYPELGFAGVVSETKWEFDLAPGASMKHTARRVIRLNGSLT